jgi:hypothetical protein
MIPSPNKLREGLANLGLIIHVYFIWGGRLLLSLSTHISIGNQ